MGKPNLFLKQHERTAESCLKTFREFGPNDTLTIMQGTLSALIAAYVGLEGYGETEAVLRHYMAYHAPFDTRSGPVLVSFNPPPVYVLNGGPPAA